MIDLESEPEDLIQVPREPDDVTLAAKYPEIRRLLDNLEPQFAGPGEPDHRRDCQKAVP